MNFIFQLIVGIVLSVASTLVQSIFQQDQKQPKSGFRGEIQTGGDNPLAFIMGFYATAGQLEYAGSWGEVDDVPNAYISQVISFADIPVSEVAGRLINGRRATLGGAPHPTLGFPVLEFRDDDGKDHLWVREYLGGQTEPDPLMRAQFGNDPERPYTFDMYGYGVPYVVVTALWNRELFTGFPEVLYEFRGIRLYDPRKDSTVGGSGSHRLNDPETWAYSDNPIVGIYNILLGILYQGQWLYGPQGITQNRLPYANWAEQMNKCDVLVPVAGGGFEKRFRFGLEVLVDEQPHVVIGELLKACEGRIAEIGGLYKVLVAEPDAPVVAFTDEDVVITEPQDLDPFPGLEATYNGIVATYPEPAEAWENKEAPPRYRSDLEALDDNRRLPFSTEYKAVPFPVQVQALGRAAIEETRRFRKHVRTAPPAWWEYEPLDCEQWTSARNGYVSKRFLITAMDDLPNGNLVVANQEIEPADYGWEADFELPWDIAPLPVGRPPAQPMFGWQVEPATFADGDGKPRRPSIRVSYEAGLIDVRAVRVQVLLAVDGSLVFDGELPYDAAALDPSVTLNATFLPNTAYFVRGKYAPFSGRRTEWSDYLPVTTPNVRIGALDIELGNLAGEILGDLGPRVRQTIESFKQLGTLLEEADRENYTLRQTLARELRVQVDNLEASFDEIIEVALDPEGSSALALAIQSLRAALGGSSAEINVRWEVIAAPVGFSARYAIQLMSNDGSLRMATFFIDLPNNPLLPPRIGFMAGQTVFFTSTGQPIALVGDDGVMRSANDTVQINFLNGNFSFGAA
ncbi:hypothetical protein [Devosia geojensis]|uniref:hypothetical protein n=1 Tax=Devosia geojensis TaxID=443610 RepID=UPI0006980B67|nr:hypothetical protein [Devosia geojensis]